MRLRMAEEADGAELLSIYRQYIDTPVTFEYTLPTRQEFETRIREITSQYPYLLWEDAGKAIGYAYAHRQMGREAYQWNAELSIYLDPSFTSRGLGKKLYLALMALLKKQGVRTVYGGVTIPNEKSERLHRGLGFGCLGIYHHTGYKCGAWHDVAWFEKGIAPYTLEPAPFVPIGKIPGEEIETVIEKYSRMI